MTDLMSVVHQISNPVKAGWVVWVAWGLVQFGWYRHARTAAPAEQPAKQPAKQPASPYGSGKNQMVSLKTFLDAPAAESSASKRTAAVAAPDASAQTSALENATGLI